MRTNSAPTTCLGLLLTREWMTLDIKINNGPKFGLFLQSEGRWKIGVSCPDFELPMAVQCGLVSLEVADAICAMLVAAARAEPREQGLWPKLEVRTVRRQYKFSYESSEWPENAVTAEEAIEPAKKRAVAK